MTVVTMPRPEPPEAPAGYVRAAEPDPDWRTPSNYLICRWRGCTNSPVANLRRLSYLKGGRMAPVWWAYCADHLYGRWIENDVVMRWVLREIPQDERSVSQ